MYLGSCILTHTNNIIETKYTFLKRFTVLQLIHVHRIITNSKKKKL